MQKKRDRAVHDMSRKMCSRAGRCSRRGHVGGGKQSGAHTNARCPMVPSPSAFSMKMSWSGYRVVRSNEDFGVLGVLGVLGDSGFLGE